MLAAQLSVFGGVRFRIGSLRVALMEPWRIWVAAGAVIAVRHLMVRHRPLYGRVLEGLTRAWRSDATRAVWPIWLVSRLGVLAVGYLAVAAIGFPFPDPPFRSFENELLNLPARFDTGWYLNIASQGYAWSYQTGGQQNIAFMPGLPMLMRVGGRLPGFQPLLAGQLIVLGASLWALVYVYRLALGQLRDPERAADAVALLAAYPFAVFLGAVYTEPLFLLAAAGAFFHVTTREWGKVAAWATLAGFLRPNAFLLAAPLAVLAMTPALWPPGAKLRDVLDARRAWAVLRSHAWPLGASSCAVIGVAAYSAFIYSQTGHPFTWLRAHEAWGRVYVGLGTLASGIYADVANRGLYDFTSSYPVNTMNAAACLLSLAALWPVTRRYGPAFGLFIVTNLIPPLMAGGLLSIGRISLVFFPVFIWMAGCLPASHRRAWIIGFAVAQGLGAALFYTWRPFI